MDLVSYTEPFVNYRLNDIPQNVYEYLLLDLHSFDSYHLVYALEIGIALRPSAFALHAARFLSHQDAAVCTTAFRVLSKLPADTVTAELIRAVRETPETELYFVHPQSEERKLFGSNQRFIQELLIVLPQKVEEGK